MACSLTITGVLGLPPPGLTVTDFVKVSGTQSGDCAAINVGNTSYNILVLVDCGLGPTDAVTRTDAAGNWSVDIKASCQCGAPIKVEAFCATDPTCTATFDGVLECQESTCPVATITVDFGECNADGTRAVTLTANVTSLGAGPTVVGQWDYGDGSLGVAFPIPAPGSFTEGPHNYAPPGPYTARLNYILPIDCPPIEVVVDLSAMEPCPQPGCPQIDAATATAAAVCNDDGTRTVSFTATVSGGPPETFHWEFGTPDGADQTIDATIPGATPNTSHDYPAPGTGTSNYVATITVTGVTPGCVDTRTVPVAVAGCGGECPTIGEMTVEVGECMGGGVREMTLDVDVAGGGITQYLWQFGDGMTQVIDATVTPDPRTTHAYPAPGSFVATLTTSGPAGCPDQSASAPVEVPACRDNGNGGNGGNPLCGSLIFVIAGLLGIAAAATILTLALSVCPAFASVTVPGWVWGIIAGLWVAAAAAIGLWYLLCALQICECPSFCDWAAIAWITALAGAVVALFLLDCCGSIWLLLVIALGLGFIAAFVYWLLDCQPGLCLILDLLAITFASVIATALVYIVAVPAIMACGLAWVEIAATTLGAGFVIAAAACHASS